MKRKKLIKKLNLNKVTVSNLEQEQQESIKGGATGRSGCPFSTDPNIECIETKPPRCGNVKPPAVEETMACPF